MMPSHASLVTILLCIASASQSASAGGGLIEDKLSREAREAIEELCDLVLLEDRGVPAGCVSPTRSKATRSEEKVALLGCDRISGYRRFVILSAAGGSSACRNEILAIAIATALRAAAGESRI